MRWARKLMAVVRKRRLDDELQEELAAHVDMLANDNVAAGMSRREARRAARIAVGNLGVAHELHRDARGLPTLESFLQDLRYAFRTLRRDYGFTTVAVLILALGIGANATVFSIVDALLLRPLPFTQPDQLVWIENGSADNPGDTNPSKLASRVLVYREWRDSSGLFADMAAYSPFFTRASWALTGDGEPERLVGVRVTDNLFPLLGVDPHVGRFFASEEVVPDGPPAVILSYGLWQRRFEGDAGMIGRSVILNDQAWTVVGVTPQDFNFGSIFAPGYQVDLFLPAILDNMDGSGNTLSVVGRLGRGASLVAAQAELDAINSRLGEERPELEGWTFAAFLSPLHEHVSKTVRNALWLLWGAVGMVLLIVCANLSNLVLVRGVSRRRELAVRAALGAGTGRLVRQLLTESLALALLGLAGGLALAFAAMRVIVASQVVVMPMLERARIDGTALALAALATFAVALIMGAVPALQVSRRDPFAHLGQSGRGAIGDRMQTWTRSSLVIAEVALACTLLIGAGLLMRSFGQILDVDLGFEPAHSASVQINAGSRYENQEAVDEFYRQLVTQVRNVPGVDGAALSDNLPLDGNRSWGVWRTDEEATDDIHTAFVRLVSEGYFDAMGISLQAGRPFTPDDDADTEPVVILNQTAAAALWPGEEAIGKMATIYAGDFRVVGVVSDVRHNRMDEEAGLEMYFALPQRSTRGVSLVVRTTGDPLAMMGQIRTAVREVDPQIPFSDFRPMERLVDRANSSRRFFMSMLAAFAGIALLLASLGIYGVISYSVGQRRAEIGLRLALGALPGRVLFEEVRRGIGMTLAGLACGMAGALLVTRLMTSQLYGVGTTDPVTYSAMPAVLLAVALFAGFLPARRAARTDPVTALRDG